MDSKEYKVCFVWYYRDNTPTWVSISFNYTYDDIIFKVEYHSRSNGYLTEQNVSGFSINCGDNELIRINKITDNEKRS